MKVDWISRSKLQFQELRKRAASDGKLDLFDQNHAEIVAVLTDVDKAAQIGEPRYRTKKAGGEVRVWVHEFVAVHFVIRRLDRVGWTLRYDPVPSTWPF